MRRSRSTSLRIGRQLGGARAVPALRIWTPPVAAPAKPKRRPPRRKKTPVAPVELAPGPYLRSDELARLEAALYLAREPLSPRRLAKLARLADGTRARALLRELKGLQEASGSAFRVEHLAGGFAYRQPVTRAEIEAIRGVGCEEMLRHLLERDFVAIGGRTEDLGRPNVYQTTNRFLRAFGLARIEDLPRLPDSGPEVTDATAEESTGATAEPPA
jgi:chromosome segregation and condensation protein ScpB